MSKSAMMLLIFTIIALFANHVSSQMQMQPLPPQITNCFDSDSAADSPFSANLKTVFTTLQTQSSTSAKFYNASSGTGTETMYGQYYCRSDIDTKPCSNCIAAAANLALENNCTNGVVFLDDCTLRFSNQSMYGILEAEAGPPFGYSTGNVSDPITFPVVLSNTINKLINEAVQSSNLFAMGKGNETVYCRVQCSSDLNATQCETCLETMYGYISKPKEEWPAIEYDYYLSCRMMYNASSSTTQSVATASPPPTPSVTAPSPLKNSPPSPSAVPSNLLTVSQPPPPSNGGSRMKVGIVTAALVILMLVLNP